MKMELKRFDIVLVDFGDDVIGSEQGGIRPAVIIQNNPGNTYSNSTIVMPLTKKIKKLNQPTHALLNVGGGKGITKPSMILGEKIRDISEKRIIKYLGTITDLKEKKK